MCSPSATSAIEPKTRPPTISATIMTLQSAITAQVRRSFFSWPSPRKTWLWVPGNVSAIGSSHPLRFWEPASFEVGLHGLDQLFGAARALGVLDRIDDVKADMILDHFGHQAVHGPARSDDQVQHGRAALFIFERALDRLDLAADAADPVEEL